MVKKYNIRRNTLVSRHDRLGNSVNIKWLIGSDAHAIFQHNDFMFDWNACATHRMIHYWV